MSEAGKDGIVGAAHALITVRLATDPRRELGPEYWALLAELVSSPEAASIAIGELGAIVEFFINEWEVIFADPAPETLSGRWQAIVLGLAEGCGW